MKIHLLSDIHLETGPYQLPHDLQCDVIVAAGDIGTGLQGVEWLKTLGKPVVYVLGNHDYWSAYENQIDMFDLIDQVRQAAANSNVHFLENESVIIGGVRFLGATLWTDFGQFNPSLITEAGNFVNDYWQIYCPRFYADPDNLASFYTLAEQFLLKRGEKDDAFRERLARSHVETGRFHPFIAYLLHQKSVLWIKNQLLHAAGDPDSDTPDRAGKTVVVTHHHPSYESLRRTGVDDLWLHPGRQFRAGVRSPNGLLYRVAAYASEVSIHNWIFHDDGANTPMINAWMCGHLHNHLDYMHDGMRVLCNPRGYYSGPLTDEKSKLFALFGASIHQEDSQCCHDTLKQNPYLGDGQDFDAHFTVDLNDELVPLIQAEIAAVTPDLQGLHAEIRELAPHVMTAPVIAKAVRESIQVRADKFESLATKLETRIAQNIGMKSPGLKAVACGVHFYRDAYASEAGFDPDWNRGFSGPAEEIAALIDAQKQTLENFASLSESLPRQRYDDRSSDE